MISLFGFGVELPLEGSLLVAEKDDLILLALFLSEMTNQDPSLVRSLLLLALSKSAIKVLLP